MTDPEHHLRELTVSDGSSRVRYFVVEDFALATTPPVSGVLGGTVADKATPAWVRTLFETGKVE